jgi:glutamyl-tRNA(Gln) amidotransferase subunit D
MKIKELNVGDKILLRTKEKDFEGGILESYDSSVVLLKLESGYNIGIRESEILGVKVIEKNKVLEKDFESEEIVKKSDDKLPNVGIVITGGTISSRLDSKTGGVRWTSVKDLFNISKDLKKICNIKKIERPFMKGSEDISFREWKIIAKKVEEMLKDEAIDGVVVTHGTDTLHYSASALSFFLGKLNKPVALTYSQRSIDRGSTDASLNLYCAMKYAVSDIAEVAIVGHENLEDKNCVAMPGTKIRKLHTSRRDAFKVVNSRQLARISKDNFEILNEFNARNKNKIKADIKFEEKVTVIKISPGQNPEILDFYQDKGYKGIVLELTGLGQAPGKDSIYNWIPKIKKLVNEGIIVCGTAQTIYGSLNPKVYSTGRELEKTGLIFLRDMLSETAFVKLGWVLGHKNWTKDKGTVKEKMLMNFANEFNSKLGFEF